MKRTKKSQKRTKFLFILIVLTAILSITATYAWFSTQRDVELSNLEVKVETAENLQISLDAENWAQSISIDDMKQLYGTQSDEDAYHADKIQNRNYIPTELLPVSTAGTVGTGGSGRAAVGELEFVKGTINGDKLTGIEKCNETDITFAAAGADAAAITAKIGTKEDNNKNHPYLAFDMYLRNLSRKTLTYTQADIDADPSDEITADKLGQAKPWDEGRDLLYLNYGSRVWVDSAEGQTGTGLENAVRIAFMPYETTVDLIKNGSEARNGTAADGTEKVSIWEPNDKEHSDYVKLNNKRGLTANTEAVETFPVKFATTVVNDINMTSADSGFDTSGLTSITTVKPEYNVTGADATITFDGETTTVTGLVGTKTVAALRTPDGTTTLGLKPGQITKVRVYLYLEGQDPDCIDMASLGKQVNATIKLVKPNNGTGTANTYK